MNSDLNLEDVLIAKSKAMFNLEGAISQIEFDRRYALSHSKTQYLSIEKQLQDKITSNDFGVFSRVFIATSKIAVTLDNYSKKWYNMSQGDEKNRQNAAQCVAESSC